MSDKKILLENLDKVHTTELGVERIKMNLKINPDNVVEYCKDKIKEEESEVYREGKNYYVINDSFKFTVNASSFTIITAHII